MTINVVEGKLLLTRLETEMKTESGIVISTVKKACAQEHRVLNSGVKYLNDGDVVVAESPSKMWSDDGYDCEVGILDATKALLKKVGSEWVPLRDDILVQLKTKNEVDGGLIIIDDNPDKELLQMFDVIKVGEDCKEIKVGDVVVLPWTRVTPPFALKGYQTYGITRESEVLAVYEQ